MCVENQDVILIYGMGIVLMSCGALLYQISHEAARAALFSQDKDLEDDALCCCRSSF